MIRRLLSIIFLLSGTAKAFNMNSFSMEIKLFADVYFTDTIRAYSLYIAILICLAEILIGILGLLRDKYKSVVALSSLVMLSMFLYITSINYFFPSIMGSVESCGCFGELIHFTPFQSVLKSSALWIVGLSQIRYISFNQLQKEIKNVLRDKITYVVLAYAAILMSVSLSLIDSILPTVYTFVYLSICFLGIGIMIKYCRKEKVL